MATFLKWLLRHVGWENIVSLGAAIGVPVWAVLAKYWNPPTAIVYGVLMFCAVTYLWDHFNIGPSLKTRVRQWLDDLGFAVTTHRNPATTFDFEVADKMALKIHVLQWITEPQQVDVVMFGLVPLPEQLRIFNEWPPERKNWFWSTVRVELFRSEIAFTDLTLEGNGITISLSIPIDKDLTKQSLSQTMLSVRSIGRLYLELIRLFVDLSTAI